MSIARGKRSFCVWVLLAGLGLSGVPRHASASVFDSLPQETLVCVGCNGLDTSLGKFDQFLVGVSPVGLTIFAKMGLSNALGNALLTGLDGTGPIAIFAMPGNSEKTPLIYGALLPVTDYQSFVENSTNCHQEPGEAFGKIAGKGLPMELSMAPVQGAVLVSQDATMLQALKDRVGASGSNRSLASTLQADQHQKLTSDAAWIYLNLRAIGPRFGPMIDAQFQTISMMMKASEETQAVVPAIGMYQQLIGRLLKQGESLTVTIDPTPTALYKDVVFRATAGSELSQALAGSGSGQPTHLAGYLENGACINLIGSKMPGLAQWFNELVVSGMFNQMDPKFGDAMTRMTSLSERAMGGAMAYSLIPDEDAQLGFKIHYVGELQDADAFDALMNESEKFFANDYPELFKKLGGEAAGMTPEISLRRGVEQYKGATVHEVSIKLNFESADVPQAKMVQSMVGDEMVSRFAITNNRLVMAFGGQTGQALHMLIDKVSAGAPGSVPSDISNASAMLGMAQKPDLMATFNVLRYFKLIMTMMSETVPLPNIPIRSKSNAAMAWTLSDGQAHLRAVLPKDHLLEIVQTAMLAKSQMEKQQEGQDN